MRKILYAMAVAGACALGACASTESKVEKGAEEVEEATEEAAEEVEEEIDR